MRAVVLLWLLCVSPSMAVPPTWQWQALADGEPVRLEQFRGQWLWLDFWASWCGPCRKSLPAYQRLWQRFESRGLQVLAVSLDEDQNAARAMVAEMDLSYVLAWDFRQQSPKAFGVRAMPMALLLDPQGRVIWRHAGFGPGDEQRIAQRLEAVLP